MSAGSDGVRMKAAQPLRSLAIIGLEEFSEATRHPAQILQIFDNFGMRCRVNAGMRISDSREFRGFGSAPENSPVANMLLVHPREHVICPLECLERACFST